MTLRVSLKTPVVADLKPSGKYTMSRLVEIGGVTPLMKRLLAAGLYGDVLTVTGKTKAENLVADYPNGKTSYYHSKHRLKLPVIWLFVMAT